MYKKLENIAPWGDYFDKYKLSVVLEAYNHGNKKIKVAPTNMLLIFYAKHNLRNIFLNIN